MEPFMDGTIFNGIIDMEVGPDGRLYLLEYGKGWFAQNSDSGIARIDFNAGNRAPVIHSFSVEETSGLLQFEAVFRVDDYDHVDNPFIDRQCVVERLEFETIYYYLFDMICDVW